MSFKSKQTQQTTSTATRDPYAAAKPGLDAAAGAVTNWMSDPNAAAAYGGPRVAGMSGMTRSGLDNLSAGAGAGTSMAYLNDVIGGKYLDAENPHLAQLTDSIKSQVMPSVNAQFSNAGMVGSTQHQGSIARGLSDALAQPLFAQYNNERGLQQQAAGMLPTIDTQAAQNRIIAGQTGEGYDQRVLDAQRAAFEEAQAKRAAQLQQATGMLGSIGQAGGTQTTSGTTTGTNSPGLGQTVLGGAMALGGLYTGGAFGGLGQAVNTARYGNNGLPWAYNPNATWNGSTWS